MRYICKGQNFEDEPRLAVRRIHPTDSPDAGEDTTPDDQYADITLEKIHQAHRQPMNTKYGLVLLIIALGQLIKNGLVL